MDNVSKKKIVSVNLSHALFCFLDFFTFGNETDMLSSNIGKEFQLYAACLGRVQVAHDSAVQALAWLHMVWFRAMWFGAAYVNLRPPHIFKCQI